MDPTDFPPLNQQNTPKSATSMDSSWADVGKESQHNKHQPQERLHQDREQQQQEEQQQPQKEELPKKPMEQTYAETAGKEANMLASNPTPAEQSQGKLLPNQVRDYVPPNPDKSYAAASSHEGFPTLEESVERETVPQNDLSDLPSLPEMLDQPAARKIPPPPPSASFAKVAAKPAPSPPSPKIESSPPQTNEEKQESDEPPSIYDEEKFPSLESSVESGINGHISDSNHDSKRSELAGNVPATMNQSYVQVASQDLDQAPPSAQSRVDRQPIYDEYDMLAESARRETRKLKQIQNSGNLDEEVTPEMTDLQEPNANEQLQAPQEPMEEETEQNGDKEKTNQRKMDRIIQSDQRQYEDKFTIFNTISTLHANNYSWLTSLAAAFLLHIRYSPLTSPYRFPFIYRSLTDVITLPIYVKALRPSLSQLPLLHQTRQQLDDSITNYGCTRGNIVGLRLYDGFRVIKNIEKERHLRWWQLSNWLSHRVQWMLSFMVLQDASAHLVTSSALLSLKEIENQV